MAPATNPPHQPHSLWALGLMLWPFATSAVAINLFMLGLLGQAIGLAALAPLTAVWLSLPLGLPATWAAARWVRSLLQQAEGGRNGA